jgi:HAD superfamily hydrolase (TIGR01509 family)
MQMPVRGIVFDLDGTLVDSALDFEQMRAEMGLPGGLPLLETIEAQPPEEADRCFRVLHEHELRGARQARLYEGLRDFLAAVAVRGWRQAVFTRNSRPVTLVTLEQFDLAFDPVFCREDGPVKPDPWAIWRICETWGFAPSQCLVIGDFRFDIDAGRAAGAHTVLFTGSGQHSGLAEHEPADFTLASYAEAGAFWRWVDEIGLGDGGPSC